MEFGAKLKHYLSGAVVVIALGVVGYGLIPTQNSSTDKSIRFTGMYGVDYSPSEIKNVELVAQRPKIKLRSNGFSLLGIKRGYFTLDDFGKCRLLIQEDLPPYLLITDQNDYKTIIRLTTKSETEEAYRQIQSAIERR